MSFLDHRSIDETQKYVDRLLGTEVHENAEIMATYEAKRSKVASDDASGPLNGPPAQV